MTRPHAHVMEDKSRNYVSTIVTNQGWIYRNREKDYGIDAELEIVDGTVDTSRGLTRQFMGSEVARNETC